MSCNSIPPEIMKQINDLGKLPIDEAISKYWNIYINNWRTDSTHFFELGYYDKFTEIIKKFDSPKLILDVGCGTGYGLFALIKAFDCEIICIEDNIECIKSAKKTLESFNIPVEIITRIKLFDNGESYINKYNNIELQHSQKVTIIQSDLVDQDENLVLFLSKYKFDAITLWLIGTHLMHSKLSTLPEWVNSNQNYRIYIQNKLYDMAHLLLKNGGIFNIVDRIPLNPQYTKYYMMDELEKHHQEQASTTDLSIINGELFEYVPPSAGITMTDGKSTETRNPLNFYSVISKKP